MKILVAYDTNRGIGFQGELPFDLAADRRLFWALTQEQAIIMGRKTYASLPRR
ncbi:MAG: dihydrofolate reductase, partial [Minisyncoccia bacterium]